MRVRPELFVLVAGCAGACRPSLPSHLLSDRGPPAAPIARLVERATPRRPGWLGGGPSPGGIALVGAAEAETRELALAEAERALAETLARRLGVAVRASHRAVRAAKGGRETDVASTAVRLGADVRTVEPDAVYWERWRARDRTAYRVWARLVVSQSTLQAARGRTPDADAGRPRVLVCLRGAFARTLESAMYFAAAGGRWSVIDPARVSAFSGCEAPQAAARALGAARVVRGVVALDPGPSIALSTEDGPDIRVRMDSWGALVRMLPTALDTVLDPARRAVGPSRGRAR